MVTVRERANQRVGAAVKARREELGLEQKDCVQRARGLVGRTTWQAVEAAEDASSFTRPVLLGVCVALGWRDDAFDRVKDGREPVIEEVALPGVESAHTIQTISEDQALDPECRASMLNTYRHLVELSRSRRQLAQAS